MSEAAIEVRDLQKTYRLGRVDLPVLRGVGFSVEPGQFVSITGSSGSGKSTLLHLVGLLDRLDAGTIRLAGEDVSGLRGRRRNRLRCRRIGFVFQFYHLLPELTVLENALLPAMVDTPLCRWLVSGRTLRRRAQELLERLGLGERLRHRPGELSGGERQRVAIARALVNQPDLLLADEPTGNLDSRTGRRIMEVLRDFHRQGQTILMVTHDAQLAAASQRVLHLADGRLEEQ
jgi:ABC-type lipoprotein export system ATPase subunit